MRTLSILSQKGGAGKTTLAVHLAVAAAERGMTTAIIDLDPQGNARRWGERREIGNPIEVVSDHANRLPQLAEIAEANRADLLIIDTAPNADQASLKAARQADFILIPCRPAIFDLEAVETTIELATIAKKPYAVVLNCSPPKRNSLDSVIVMEARRQLGGQGAVVYPKDLAQRVDYSHAVIDGRTALDLAPLRKAAREVRELLVWTCRQMDGSARLHVTLAAE